MKYLVPTAILAVAFIAVMYKILEANGSLEDVVMVWKHFTFEDLQNENYQQMVFIMFGFLAMIPAMLIPIYVAGYRRHNNSLAITVCNLTFGWTGVGWIATLIWACTNNLEPQWPGVTLKEKLP
jgi:hypothetical protein